MLLRAPCVAVIVLLTPAARAAAQRPARPDTGSSWVVEREVRQRWIQGDQHPGFVPFVTDRESIHVRRREVGTWRYLEVRGGRWNGSLRLDDRNRLLSVDVDPPSISVTGYQRPGSTNPWQSHLGNLRDLIANLWEMPVVLPGEPLAPGSSWTDTLSWSVDPADQWTETLDGVWRHEVVGDTLVDGRRLPLVSTEALVRNRSFEAIPDAAVEGTLVVERALAGTLVGRVAVDTALGLRAAGRDSAAWEGVATLHTQDGRSFDAPLRYERVRTWRLRDSGGWAAVQDSLRAARERESTGMLILPTTALQERLARGDSALLDSLRTVWRATDDPNKRDMATTLLGYWASRGPWSREELDTWLTSARLELGDSATVLADRLDGSSRLQSLTQEDLDELLPWLDDLGRLWRIGVTPRWTYSTLADGLLDDTPILQPDRTEWTCTPAACDRVMGLLETASEPQLRDLALVVVFGRDPARWYDRLRARADSGSLLVDDALRLGAGVHTTGPVTPEDSIPPPGASWRRWLAWAGPSGRLDRRGAYAIRMYSARTGRDVVQELRRAWPPDGDSARAVLGTILRGVGALDPPTLDELAEAFLSGSVARIREARNALSATVRPARAGSEPSEDVVAPPDVAAELLPPLVDSVLAGGSSPWPGIGSEGTVEPGAGLYRWTSSFHGVRGVPVFLLDENLPPGFTLPPGAGLSLIDQETWNGRPPREGGALLRLGPATAAGPFVALAWDWTVLRRRDPDEAPSGYAGGGSVWLLRTGDTWIVVNSMSWIT